MLCCGKKKKNIHHIKHQHCVRHSQIYKTRSIYSCKNRPSRHTAVTLWSEWMCSRGFSPLKSLPAWYLHCSWTHATFAGETYSWQFGCCGCSIPGQRSRDGTGSQVWRPSGEHTGGARCLDVANPCFPNMRRWNGKHPTHRCKHLATASRFCWGEKKLLKQH